MEQHDQFVTSTGLEKAVLYVTETDVYFITFLSDETDAVLMDFKVSKCFLADKVWSNNQIVKSFLSAWLE